MLLISPAQNFYFNVTYKNILSTLTMSSIFRIDLTVSVAKLKAEVLTNKGCTTFSSKMSVIAPLRTLIPAEVSPLA